MTVMRPVLQRFRPNPGVLFALPALIVLALLILYPLVYTIVLSLTNQHGSFVGWSNYSRVLSSPVTATALVNTIYYVVGSIVFQVALGTAVGILLNQEFRGRALVRSLTLVPWVIPGIVAATTWAWMFHTEFGIINYMATQSGLIAEPKSWLSDVNTVLPALITVNIWKMFPFVAIMVLAGLQAVPEQLYEAARVDGASFWQEVWFVTLPQLRPVLVAITMLLMIWGLNGITIIYAMTQGGPANRSLITPIQIYQMAFQTFHLNDAAALSVAFFLVVAVLTAVYIALFADREPE